MFYRLRYLYHCCAGFTFNSLWLTISLYILQLNNKDQVIWRKATLLCMGVFGTPIWGEGETVRGSAMVPLKRLMVVSYRLYCEHRAISDHSATICHRLQRWNQEGVGYCGTNLGEEGVDWCNGAVLRKRNHAEEVFCQWGTMHVLHWHLLIITVVVKTPHDAPPQLLEVHFWEMV